ncbi:condensation domain-containing protein, partial [Micromonospora andamanensis]
TEPSIDLAAADVRRWLDERLPGHMVPEQFAVLDELPLTSNGKVDRAAVAAGPWWAEEQSEDEVAPPQGRMEELLGDLWLEFLPVERVTRTDNFFRCGGDSLIGTRLVARLGSVGVEGAELRGLFANPTLAGFAATLDFGATSAARFVAEPDARHDPFPVTDVQQAYLLGRRPEFTLGGVGCHFYVEFDSADVDVARLEQAWNTLIARHDMLRAVFDETGQQRVLATVPGFAIPVTEVAADEAEPALTRLRTEMSHRLFDPAQWPLFDVRAVRYGQRVRLGVGLDNLVLDALSVLILFTELNLLYDDPQAVLRPVGVTFRDYQMNTRPDPGELAAAREYWSSRLDRLPPAPDLPLAVDPVHITAPRFLRRQLHLDREHWGVITKRAREHEITPSALLLACYAEVLGAWSGRPDMTLTLTTFRRQEVHPDINNILGDFTSLLLVAYEPEPGTGLAARARALQEQMWRDLDHQAVSATWVLREMARRAGLAETSMPVVFTSALGVLDGLDTTAAADFAWGISQTPQVWLDHQVREYADGLAVNWDHVEGLFPPGVIDQMFGAYQAALDWLATGDWSAPLPVSGPARDIAPVSR